MNRLFSDYQLYVFDLDGTLYDQPYLRMMMVVRLLKYYLVHPFNINELLLLQQFRSVKDKWDAENESTCKDVDSCYISSGIDRLDYKICSYIARNRNINVAKVASVVKHWIYDDPIESLKIAKDEKLIEYIDSLRKNGKKVAILSDYPVEVKLSALDCKADAVYSSTDDRIMELKPSPKGLNVVLSDFDVEASKALMIGDRFEKDGMAAINANVDYLILPRKVAKRSKLYDELGI